MTVPLVPAAGYPAPAPVVPLAGAVPGGAPYTPPQATCANCLAPLGGDFCARCGAPSLEQRPVTVRRFIGDLANELTSIDSITLRTVRSLLTRPGELTRDYLAGRTRWYLSPVRIYLVMFAVLLAGEALLPDTAAMYRQMEATLTAQGVAQQRSVAAAVAAQQRPATAFQRVMLQMDPAANAARTVAVARFTGESKWIQLINAVTWAALLALLFRGRRRNYAEHVVFALHLLAFNLLIILTTATVRTTLHVPVAARLDWLMLAHWLAIGTYFFLASRRLYAESRPRTAVKSVVFVSGAQLCMILVTWTALIVVGIRQGAEHARNARVAAPAAAAPVR